ncbi:DUF6629 family protein [Nitrosomonas sp.]|uniref:DUF6629 family protein n=1 Tax=Nitrosomonas sp. TaxID=42353 RepID=UPI002085C3E3|nr:DUF6629 family protein [Nitrosomonas sp.]GJL74054.1 MAG: hypothetical protein NMNS02_01600 [Nitrosomonas sp.]
MCFSAEASFIVGGSLVLIGAAIIKKVHYKRDIPVALIPLIFAAQQIIEGLLWVSLNNGDLQAQFWLSHIYGVFVGVIWPLYVPFAIYCTETDRIRRKIIAAAGLAGLTLAIYTIDGIVSQPISVKIINNHIYYEHDIHIYPLVIMIYLFATCIPFILSGFRNLHLTGITVTFSFFVAYFIYTKTFVSVWCFFAAIASALIFLYFIKRARKPLIPIA